MEKNNLMEDAIRFALEKHAGAFRKGTEIPYITHPLEALVIASTMTVDPQVLAAAVLHDTVEDTDATVEEIRFRFGERVAELVTADSEDKREEKPASETWELRKQETIDFLSETADRDMKIVALSDKLSNIRAIQRDYEAIGDRLWERFNQKDKNRHAWYYKSLVTALSDLSDTAAWKEYDSLVKKVFG